MSTTYILSALKQNNRGHLYSVDMRDPVLPPNIETGWIIPKFLKNRWTLIVGKSSETLVPLLEELKEIDVFQHDSEHSYKNMMFEYQNAWKYLKRGGVVLSDDIRLNNAWRDFTAKSSRVYNFYSFGAVVKG